MQGLRYGSVCRGGVEPQIISWMTFIWKCFLSTRELIFKGYFKYVKRLTPRHFDFSAHPISCLLGGGHGLKQSHEKGGKKKSYRISLLIISLPNAAQYWALRKVYREQVTGSDSINIPLFQYLDGKEPNEFTLMLQKFHLWLAATSSCALISIEICPCKRNSSLVHSLEMLWKKVISHK